MTTSRMGCRYATSVGGTLTGRGGNFIIIDDPIKPGAGDVGGRAQPVNQWYENTVYSRLNVPNDDVIVLVMQRVHVDDLMGHVLEKENWELPRHSSDRRRAACLRPRPRRQLYARGRRGLDPDRLNRPSSTTSRPTSARYNFEAQYQQRPVPPAAH